MTRMLTLYAPIQTTKLAQQVAHFVKDGFRAESWNALALAGTVYGARITALPNPDQPELFSSLLLCTTYEGPSPQYHRFFWDKLTLFFGLVAFAAVDSPFGREDLTAEQGAAFDAAMKALIESDTPASPNAADAAKNLPKLMEEVTRTMNLDDADKYSGKIAKTKFERFSAWVDKHDLTFAIGTPAAAGQQERDPRRPPEGNDRIQFIAPSLPKPVW
jgi:hypothetical protein